MRKTAIVTGGARGIGLAISRQLAKDGFNIAILGTRDKKLCKDELKSISEAGARVLYISGSIASGQDRERLVKETVSEFGGIDLLVNNAGVSPRVRSDLLEMTEESFDYVLGINTKGTMFMTQAVSKRMLRQVARNGVRGTIVNISSCSAVVSSTNRGEYCVSKAGVSMLTTLYADRLAQEGILVYEVRPGVIATDMTSAVKEKYDALIDSGAFPLARWGQPEYIASAVSAFAGGKFPYSTGSYIDVDGGFHIRKL